VLPMAGAAHVSGLGLGAGVGLGVGVGVGAAAAAAGDGVAIAGSLLPPPHAASKTVDIATMLSFIDCTVCS
jgi:hypothetical protein